MTQTREALVELMARAICKVNEVSDDVFTEQPLHNRWIEDAAAALLALEAAGVRLVPVEATLAMVDALGVAAQKVTCSPDGDDAWKATAFNGLSMYRAMLSASPYAKDAP
jgi:hypothetical protein